MTSVRRSLALSLIERYLLIMLALASNMILARLLTPEQIGIYSVSLAVIGIAQVLRDFGIGNFLIQERNLEEGHIKTAFGLSMLLGGSLFSLVFFFAPWAASFYAEGRMEITLRIVSLNFLILPFCTISLALLRREMQFLRLLYVNISAAIASTTLTIGLAYAGWGPDSLAAGSVIGNIVTGVAAWLTRTRGRLLMPSLTHWRVLLRFSSHSSSASIVTTIAMDINELVVSKILGFASVAMISRAQGLMNLIHRDILSAVRNVAYPSFASAARDGMELEVRHCASVANITCIAWPAYGFIALLAPEIVHLMFGSQWHAAAVLVPWFCLGGALAAIYSLVIPLLTAQGRVDLGARIDLVFQPIRALVTVLAVWMTKSMLAFAISFLALTAASLVYHYVIKHRVQPTRLDLMLDGLGRSLLVTAISIAPVFIFSLVGFRTDGLLSPIAVALLGVGLLISWISSVLLARHPLTRDPLTIELIQRVRRMTKHS